MTEKIFYFLADAAVTAGIAAVAVIIARLLIRRAPKKWAYMMWAVVFFRCLCPFSLQSGLSLFNVFDGLSAESEAAPAQVRQDIGVTAPISFEADNAPSEIVFEPKVPTVPAIPTVPQKSESGQVTPKSEPKKAAVDMYAAALALWACGAAAMGLYGIISSARLNIKLKTAVKTEDGVFESDRIATAFTAGLFRPRIYLPCGLPPEQRELIILHERVHIRRRDYILKPLAFAGLAVHWFDPLIWAAFALMTRDMETSCDEAVLRICGEDKKTAYSEALLNASVRSGGITAGISFGRSGVKERVRNVLDYKKPKLWATMLAAAVMFTACGLVGTDAKTEENAETTETTQKVKYTKTQSELMNEDTSAYFPVNSKGQTYGIEAKDENGVPVVPDLVRAMGYNGTEGYITKTSYYNLDGADKEITAVRFRHLSDEFKLEEVRKRYKSERDDYGELQFYELTYEIQMYDVEGEPINDVFSTGFKTNILGEPCEFEDSLGTGMKITVDKAGNVAAFRKDGTPVKVINEITENSGYFESVINQDTSAYFPVNAKGQTYGEAGSELDRRGVPVIPDLVAVKGAKGTAGYVQKAAYLIQMSDDPSKYIVGIRSDPLLEGEQLEMRRNEYKDTREDYEELDFLTLSYLIPMYDAEGEPLDDLYTSYFGTYILGEEYSTFQYGKNITDIEISDDTAEISSVPNDKGFEITVYKNGDVVAVNRDGSEIPVDNYVPGTAFKITVGMIEGNEDDSELREHYREALAKRLAEEERAKLKEEEEQLSEEQQAKIGAEVEQLSVDVSTYKEYQQEYQQFLREIDSSMRYRDAE